MRDLRYGVQHIWATDEEMQLACLESLITQIRGVSDPDIVARDVESLVRIGAFYVPDDYYMIMHFGDSITKYEYGLYRGNQCTIAGRLAIPMEFLDGGIYGFIGYSNESDQPSSYEVSNEEISAEISKLAGVPSEETSLEEGAPTTFIKYLYPPQFVMEKARYMFIDREEYIKALKDGYICITDGVFDKHRLSSMGYNAVSLCGSNLTKWHRYYLSFIPHKIVIADNDSAGVKLARICKSQLDGCVQLSFPVTKDIDDFLKTKEGIAQFESAFSVMQDSNFAFSYSISDMASQEIDFSSARLSKDELEEAQKSQNVRSGLMDDFGNRRRFMYANEISEDYKFSQDVQSILNRFDEVSMRDDTKSDVDDGFIEKLSEVNPTSSIVDMQSSSDSNDVASVDLKQKDSNLNSKSVKLHNGSVFAKLCMR